MEEIHSICIHQHKDRFAGPVPTQIIPRFQCKRVAILELRRRGLPVVVFEGELGPRGYVDWVTLKGSWRG